MSIALRSCDILILVLLLLIVKATASSNNETSQERRQSRVTGRKVKLYSGTRPEPILCAGEGFQADPRDCAVFYRCMKSGNGKYTVFRFQCGPGTVYDPETEVCNHPRSTKRSECGGFSPPLDHINNNEIERNQNEIPSPITNKPVYTDKPKQSNITGATLSTGRPWVASSPTVTTTTKRQIPVVFTVPTGSYPWVSSTGQSYIDHEANRLGTAQYTVVQNQRHTEVPKVSPPAASSDLPQSSSRDNNICTSDGFMGDTENCRKFYRCVANQRGTYTRYEFSCSETTVWDDDTQSCNHAWAVKRSRCGRSNEDNPNKLLTTENIIIPQKDSAKDKTIQQQLQISHGSKVTQTQTQISNGSVIQNQTQIHYGDRINQNKDTEARQNQTQISHGSAISQTQTQIDYTNKGVQTQLQIDHSQQASQTQVQVHESTTLKASSTYDSSINHGDTQGSNECQKSGFMGDLNDCKKFYRCIENGRGGYTKFEFSCGEGTVWDQNIEACNHAWAVKDCGGKGSTVTTSTTQSSTSKSTPNYQSTVSTENYHTTLEVVDTEDNEDSGYGQQNQGTTTSSTTLGLSTTTLGLSTTKSPSKGDCQSSGFIGDRNDCKIFYRCVENGKGSFTKYEFKCGEGTVWDPDLEACNHAWAVKHCGGIATPDIDKTEMTTEKHSTLSTAHTSNSIVTQSTTESVATQSDDYDTGYGPVHNDFTPATTTTTTIKPQNIEHSTNNDCQSSGFLGDKNDCKKFYRCVDNGNGGYTRYEFTCGEGTVWDSKIEACNHAWAVEKCGGSSQQEATTEPKPAVVSSSSTESIQNTVPTLTPSTTYSSTAIVTESVATGISDCTHSGFVGDQKDCKKFYRCVDNGKGSFTKYEFSCGEGTVWDPEIEACNHEWAVEKCGGISKPSESHHESTTQYHPTISDEIDNGYPAIIDADSNVTTQSTTTYHTTEGSKETDEGTNCINSGFIGDKNECKKFYRCVDDGKGSFIRYEFTCGEGTLWDQSIEACNHEWAVKNCGKTNNNTMQIPNESSTQATSSQETDQGYPQNTEKTSTSTIVSTFPDTELNNVCTKDGFIGDSNNCKKFYRCVDNGQGGFTKYEFACAEGTSWNQEILSCDHVPSNKTCPDKESGSSTQPPQYEHDEMNTGVTSISSTSTVRYENENPTQKPLSPSGICISEGFYGDLNDCKKFYRCVNDGKGSFTKYDFTCGDGTIWDQEIQTCNHESSNKTCSSSFPSDSNVSQTTENQPLGGNDVSTTTTSQTQHTIQTSTSSTSSSSQCTSEGFFADPKNCKKFIRCVSNEKGGYTKYEFICGEGTVWVQDILACDHDTGDTNCSSQIISKPHTTEGYEQTTQKYNPNTSTSEPQTIDKQEDEYDNGNLDSGHSTSVHPIMHDEDNTISTETSSTMKTTTSGSNTATGNKNICDKEGYFGDTQDCKKFYRCVDNGKGGYTKYDFTCGEGTIWDQDVTTCNHPQDVVNPSCNQNQDGSSTSTTAATSTSSESSSTSSSSSSSSSSTSQTTTTTTEGTQTSSNCSQEETSKKPVNQNITCDKGGYYPNPNDCKKFYRCVDWDGDGKRFSVYHFECGEGTIWDPAVETCNHEESVYPPRDCSGSQSQNVNESSTTEGTTASQTSPSGSTTTEKSSTSQSSTQTGQSTTSEQSTTQQSTTSEQSTTQQSTTSEQSTTQQSTTSEQSTTQQSTTSEPTTTQQSTTSEQSTTQPSSTSEPTTTQQSTTSDQTTTPQSSSSEQTTTQQSTTSDQTTPLQSTTSELTTTTQQSTTSELTTTSQQSTTSELTTTTQQSTTSEQATSEQSTQQPTISETTTTQQSTTSEQTTQQTTVSEPTTSEQSTTSEQTTTEQSPTTEQTTTQQSTSSQQTTQEPTTSEQTTQASTTTDQLTTSEQTTTELSTTSESTTEQASSTTEASSTEQSTTSQPTTTEQSQQNTTDVSTSTEGTTTEVSTTEQSTTEQTGGTSSTESTGQNTSDNKCPETNEDQTLFVCPTSFRRHPKYCNLFYQCDENDDTHDLKIAVFTCPNNTIYDETQTRCVEESKADKKCNGKIAQKSRFKRLDKDYREPIVVTTDSFSCPSPGYYSFEKDSECSPAFLKCKTDKQNKLRGLVYQCPTGYIYWTVSKRCEPMDKIRDCKRSHNDWTARWEIPVERRNVASM